MKLIFGDPKSIQYKEKLEQKKQEKKLLQQRPRCPLCGEGGAEISQIDWDEKWVFWVWNCKKNCPNSCEYIEEHGEIGEGLYCTDFNGKFLDPLP